MKGELAKAKDENTELWIQLQGSQDDLQTVERNSATLSGQVMSLEKQLKKAEEKLHIALEVEEAAREATVAEARQKEMVDFKESKKYKLATQDFDADYDKGVE